MAFVYWSDDTFLQDENFSIKMVIDSIKNSKDMYNSVLSHEAGQKVRAGALLAPSWSPGSWPPDVASFWSSC